MRAAHGASPLASKATTAIGNWLPWVRRAEGGGRRAEGGGRRAEKTPTKFCRTLAWARSRPVTGAAPSHASA